MRFANPVNGYSEKVNFAFFWCFLFGPLYFVVKGVWTHALISLLLVIFTAGLSWLIYPFFARAAVERYYLRQGWVPRVE